MFKAKNLEIVLLTASVVTCLCGVLQVACWLFAMFIGLLGSHLAWVGGRNFGREQVENK